MNEKERDRINTERNIQIALNEFTRKYQGDVSIHISKHAGRNVVNLKVK